MIMAIDRRFLLKHAAALPLLGTVAPFSWAAGESEAVKADYTLRIAPVTLELAPGKTIETTGYNGTVPGPALRLREGRPVSINVINDLSRYRALAWSLSTRGTGRRNRGRLANHPSRAVAPLFLHAETVRHALVSQPRYGDD
jgi:hypothetical protein